MDSAGMTMMHQIHSTSFHIHVMNLKTIYAVHVTEKVACAVNVQNITQFSPIQNNTTVKCASMVT